MKVKVEDEGESGKTALGFSPPARTSGNRRERSPRLSLLQLGEPGRAAAEPVKRGQLREHAMRPALPPPRARGRRSGAFYETFQREQTR